MIYSGDILKRVGFNMTKYTETQRKILEVGKEEFLAKGFKDASLRGIVKAAGFTKVHFTATIQTRRLSLMRWCPRPQIR